MQILCRYGCKTPIKFDDSRFGAKGLKIPLNLDGSPHDCPERPYNKKRQRMQRQSIASVSNKLSVVTCKYCTQRIYFDDKVTAPSGKRIPLNQDSSHHECRNSPFNLTRRPPARGSVILH